jgi:hypothetical protein
MIDYDKYIYSLNLAKLRQKRQGYNSVCPICDDSIAKKHRLWLLRQNDGGFVVKCFNAGCILEKATSFHNFLKLSNMSLFNQFENEYKKEKFNTFIANSKNSFSRKTILEEDKITNIEEVNDGDVVFYKRLNPKIFKPILRYEEAISYLENRKIPKQIYKDWFFVQSDIDLMLDFKGHIVIPFKRNSDNKVYGFNSRSIYQKEFRNYLFSENGLKIYNFYNVDITKDIYVFESVFDSLYIDNSIASCGVEFPSDKILNEKYSNIDKSKFVFCFDYDETGLNKALIRLLENKQRVFIFPEHYQKKTGDKIDMNQLVNDASFELVTKEQVRKMILSNIYMPDSKINIVKILNILNRNRWKMSANVRKLTQL